METLILVGSILGIGFVSGINLYATVLALGLSVKLNLLQLSPTFADIHILSEPAILWTAGVLYTLEFFSDKIPWVDSLWDVLHTFVRPIGAAGLAAVSLGDIDPIYETVLILLAGGVALTSHVAKASTRIVVNHSPEPFSNWFLSAFEDILVVFGVFATLFMPLITLVAVLIFLVGFVWLFPKVVRLIRSNFRRFTQ